MLKGNSDYLKDIASTYVCSEHGLPVTVAWHALENSYVLRCGHGEYPEEVTREPSFTELNKQGRLATGPIKDNLERRKREKAMTQEKKPTALTMGGVPATDLGTGELLALEVVKALTEYAEKYELDPCRGHVVLMYGKPYITLDGYYYHAYKSWRQFSVHSRPMSDEERRTYKIEEDDHFWLTSILFGDTNQTFTGIGIVTKDEMTAKSKRDPSKLSSPVVAAHPWQLAQKRAEWQALRRAFPIGETREKEDG